MDTQMLTTNSRWGIDLVLKLMAKKKNPSRRSCIDENGKIRIGKRHSPVLFPYCRKN